MRSIWIGTPGVLWMALAACGSVTEADDAALRCPPTSEFGNFGCARVAALVAAPVPPIPARYLVEVTVKPVCDYGGWTGAVSLVSDTGAISGMPHCGWWN